METFNKEIYRQYLKRPMDVLLSLLVLILLSPVLLVVTLLVRIKLGSPIFFVQERPGQNGRIFHMVKFRTMLNTTDQHGVLLPNEKRHTGFGRFLRSASLDELPELLNVIKGDMSLVGPRPLLVEYLPLYSPEQARRHEVRPGITGWAQVNGRNAISWADKFRYDIWYVDHVSLLLDLKILLWTIKKVFFREAIKYPEDADSHKFTKNGEINQ